MPRLLGGFRLALLVPLYICLVAIDEKSRWIALCLYLGSLLAGLWERGLSAPQTALSRIGDGLLLLVMSLGLVVGGVTTIGSAAACAILIGRILVRLELARADPARFALGRPGRTEVAVAVLTVVSFVLALAPRIIGVPKSFDAHQLGGYLLMVCSALALVSLTVELVRKRRSVVIRAE